MAQGMKQIAQSLTTALAEDSKVIDEINSKQDKNLIETNQEVENIKNMREAVAVGFCYKIVMAVVAIAVFAFMVVFIRLFPNKRYL